MVEIDFDFMLKHGYSIIKGTDELSLAPYVAIYHNSNGDIIDSFCYNITEKQ